MKTETWVRLAAIGVCTAVAAAVGYVLIRYFSGILFPFLAAALVASALRPAARKLRRHTRIPEKAGGTILIVGAVALLSWGAVALGQYVYDGAKALITSMMNDLANDTGPLHGLSTLSRRLTEIFPAEGEALGSLNTMASGMLREAASAASSALTEAAAAVLVEFPGMILSVAVFVIALFYLFFDHGTLRGQLGFFLSEGTMDRLGAFFSRIREGVGGCVRAYALLLLLTFSELLAGFLLLNIEDAPLKALLVSVVDLLPVFGVGTVLLPWSLLSFLSGDVFRGAGLLVLFAVMYTVRQFAEPRLVGNSLGIHPLFTLAAVFAGLRLFGLGGMLAAPILLYAVKAAFSQPAQPILDRNTHGPRPWPSP